VEEDDGDDPSRRASETGRARAGGRDGVGAR
jgi:hypothetical protein